MLGALELEAWQQLVLDGLPGMSGAQLDWIDEVAGGWAFYVQMAATIVLQENDLNEAGREFRFHAEDRFRELWKDLKPEEQRSIRDLVQAGTAIGGGMGDRLFRYGVLRQDGRLFSSMFEEWIQENGGGI